MLKIAICDDEKEIRDEINKLLMGLIQGYEVSEFISGDEMLDTTDKFDIYILDIEMPGLGGMEVAEKLLKTYGNPYIIILTNHLEQMKFGYKVGAFRFLGKPIDIDEFNEAINSAEKKISDIKTICIRQKRQEICIKHSDIVYIESLGDNTSIFTVNGTYICNKSMKRLLEELGDTVFFQSHRSNTVSLERILKIGDVNVSLLGADKTIPVSRRNQPLLKKAYHLYMKENGRMN